MYEKYPAIYRDERGEEPTVITNDGKQFSMTVRNVEFVGIMLDDFEPVEGSDPAVLSGFTWNRGELCGCEIEYHASLPIVENGQPAEATVHVRLGLGLPTERGGLDHESLALSLDYRGETYHGRGTSGWYEDELLDIQAALPAGVYMRACINCAFSDYSPYGHGLFGYMLCFRDSKAAYRKVRGKDDLFHILDDYTELVQETYRCPEFERRIPGTGYRG